jgi:hypothetical protein
MGHATVSDGCQIENFHGDNPQLWSWNDNETEPATLSLLAQPYRMSTCLRMRLLEPN